MTQRFHNSLLNSEKSNSREMTSFYAKFMSLSLHNVRISKNLELTLMFFDNLQIISQTLLQADLISSKNHTISQIPFKYLYSLLKVLNPGYLLDFNQNTSLSWIIIFITLCYTFMKFTLLLCVLVAIAKKFETNKILTFLWQWTVKLQSLTSFITVSISINLLSAISQNNIDNSGLYITVCTSFIFSEILISYAILSFFTYLLPSKSLISSKNKFVDLILQTHKLILMAFQPLIISVSFNLSWILTLIGFFLSLFSTYFHLNIMPEYNSSILIWKGSFLSLITTLNFIFLFRAIYTAIIGPLDLDSILLVWMILIPFTIKFSSVYLKNKVLRLTILPTNFNMQSNHLIAKIMFSREIIKNQIPVNLNTPKIDCSHLIYKTIQSSDSHNILIPDRNNPTELQTKDLLNFDNLSRKFPGNTFYKLFIAYYYGKKLKNYETSLEMLSIVEKSSSTFQIRLNTYLLKEDIQRKFIASCDKKAIRVDLSSYINAMKVTTALKKKINHQVNLQINLCQEYLKVNPDLSKIYNWSLSISKERKSFENFEKIIQKRIPEYYTEPYSIFQQYYLVANYSPDCYNKYSKIITQKKNKYENHFQSENINNVNIFQSNNIFMVISGQRETLGAIFDCSKSVEPILNWNSDLIIGKTIFSIVPPSLHQTFNKKVRDFLEDRNHDIFEIFLQHKAGHIVQFYCSFGVNSHLNQGFYLNILFRPIFNYLDYLIVTKEKLIDSYTQNIGQKLNLKLSQAAKIHMNQISEDFNSLIDAANGINDWTYKKGFGETTSYYKCTQNFSPDSDDNSNCNILSSKIKSQSGKPIKRSWESNDQNFSRKASRLVNAQTLRNDNQIILLKPLLKVESVHGYEHEMKKNLLYSCKIENKCSEEFQGWIVILRQMSESQKNTCELINKEVFIKLIHKDNQNETEPSEFIEFSLEDEKKGGWINLKKNEIEQEQSMHSAFSKFMLKKLNTFNMEKKELFDGNLVPTTTYIENIQEIAPMSEPKLKKYPLAQRHEDSPKYKAKKSLETQSSQFTEKYHQAYENALEVKYYSKHVSIMLLAIFAIGFCLMPLQIQLEINATERLTVLSGRKEVLWNAEARNYYLIKVLKSTRYLWDSGIGRVTKPNPSALSVFIRVLGQDVMNLTDVNQALLVATESLKVQDREKLFESNVNIYETYLNEPKQIFINLTTFQAVDLLVQYLDKALSLISINPKNAIPFLKLVFRNALNDLLLVSEETVLVFLDDLKYFEDQNRELLVLTLVISLIVLVTTSLISAILIYYQHSREKKYMLSFSALDATRISQLMQKLKDFNKILQVETPQQKYLNTNTLDHTGSVKSKKKVKKVFKNPQTLGILSKYLYLFLKYLLFVISFGILYGTNFIILNKHIRSAQEKLHQIYFSHSMRSKIYLAFAITEELLAEGDKIRIHNEVASVQLEKSLQDLSDIHQTLTSGFFRDEGRSYDPTIETLVFRKACAFLTGYSLTQCQMLEQGATNLNFISLLADLEYYIKRILNDYSQSDKDVIAITALNDFYTKNVQPRAVTLGDLNSLVSNQLQRIFDNYIGQARFINSILSKSIYGALVVIGIFLWVFVFKPIREVDNRLKQVLKVFPSEIVFNNFILKDFVKKTSKGLHLSLK